MTLSLPERHNGDIQTEEEPSFGDSPVKVMARLWCSHHDPIKMQGFSPTKLGPKTPSTVYTLL